MHQRPPAPAASPVTAARPRRQLERRRCAQLAARCGCEPGPFRLCWACRRRRARGAPSWRCCWL